MLSTPFQSEETSPSPRAGHSLTITSSGTGFLFGGANHEQGFLDDSFTFQWSDKDGISWKENKLSQGLKYPPARYEHAAIPLPNGEVLIVFGAGSEGPLDDLWIYNPDNSSWRQLETKGSKPSKRVVKSVAYSVEKNRVYLFGGGQFNNIPVPDTCLYCLDLNALLWVKLHGGSDPSPSPRLGHTLTLADNSLYLFGGLDAQNAMDDLWKFDLDTNRWTNVETTGKLPSARCAHTCNFVDNQLVVVGGMAPSPPSVFSTISVLNLETFIWTEVVNDVSRRLDHSSTLLSHDQLLLFGGMDLEHVFHDAHILHVPSTTMKSLQ